MEYLAQCRMSPDHITNHTTVVRSMCIVYGCNTLLRRDQGIPLFITSLKLNCSFTPRISILIDDTLLLQIIQSLLSYTILLCIQLFICCQMRQSNILPHSVNSFDKTRHLCVGDVIFSDHNAIIVIKWSKSFQDHVMTTIIDISSLGSPALGPETALSAMLATWLSSLSQTLLPGNIVGIIMSFQVPYLP